MISDVVTRLAPEHNRPDMMGDDARASAWARIREEEPVPSGHDAPALRVGQMLSDRPDSPGIVIRLVVEWLGIVLVLIVYLEPKIGVGAEVESDEVERRSVFRGVVEPMGDALV